MKKILKLQLAVLFLILISPTSIFAQEKMGIGIVSFQHESSINPEQVNVLQDIITNIFVNSGRFRILEREMLNGVLSELELQKSDDTILSDEFVEQGKIAGADYLLLGKISRIEIERTTGKNALNDTRLSSVTRGDEEFLAFADMTLRLVNTETGQIVGSTTINIKPGIVNKKLFIAGTEAEALQKLKDPLEKNTKAFIGEYLPLEINVGKLISEKKGKVQEVYILGGEEDGLTVGTEIVIYSITMEDVGDEKPIQIKSEIASGKISEMKGQKICVASIKKGGDRLLSDLNSGVTLVCKTTNVK